MTGMLPILSSKIHCCGVGQVARSPECETEERHILPHLTYHMVSLPDDTTEQEEVDGHECRHRQSRDGHIQLTTDQPRGPLRSQVLSKAANMCTLHNVCRETEVWELCHHVVVLHLAEKNGIYGWRPGIWWYIVVAVTVPLNTKTNCVRDAVVEQVTASRDIPPELQKRSCGRGQNQI